jgi:hypothetical protein
VKHRTFYPLYLSAVLSAALLLASCAPKSIVTPEVQRAYTAHEVLIRVSELQKAAIQANTDKALSDSDAIVVVQFTTSAAETLRTAPIGWPATIRTAWSQVKTKVSTAGKQTLTIVFTLIDGVLAAVSGD